MTDQQAAFVFPGQGAQQVGMGRDLYETFPAARAVYDEADAVLGFPLSRLCFEGPKETLDATANTQPALLTTSIAILRAWNPPADPLFYAGHSLGEYTALVAAGSLAFADAVRLVRRRGELMAACPSGSMAAVLGLDDETLAQVCYEASEACAAPVVCANLNAPGQVVLAGEQVALETAARWAKERGARRVVPLAVTVAGHSPLMAAAATELAMLLEHTEIHPARVPVVSNVTARPVTQPAEIRQALVQHLTSPLRWVESVQYMRAQSVQQFVEVGPGDVLAGLIRRIDREAPVVSIGTVSAVQQGQ
ncbi:MAG: ACP S-malonyltransferase [Chloroflexi bacterium]|nr:ACP S-malonyltransferase [Chloroflexota bacterium]MBU1746555.1 ACP S-malonyltransferase [Chloroflexota bacterium]